MSPILDPSGRPLPPTNPQREVDTLNVICSSIEAANGWEKAYQRYEALLGQLEPHAAQLDGMVKGKTVLDGRTQEGQQIFRFVTEVAALSMVFKRKVECEARALAEAESKASEANGHGDPKPDGTEDA